MNKPKLFSSVIYKDDRQSMVGATIWAVVISVLIIVAMSIYPLVVKAMAHVPSSVQAYIGQLDNINLYFETEATELWVLLACVYGAVLVHKLFVSTLKGRQCEVVFTSPISRGQVVRTKAVRILINLTLVSLVAGLVSWLSLYIWGGDFSVANLCVFTFLSWLVSLTTSYIIFGISMLFGKRMNAIFSVVPLIMFYVFFVFSKNVDVLSYFTPFSVLGGVLNLGIQGISHYGLPLYIWVAVTAVINVIGAYKFKNSDLC